MVAIEEALQIEYLTNSNGNLKSSSDLMNARQSSRSFRNDGLLKEHSHGWKTSGGAIGATSGTFPFCSIYPNTAITSFALATCLNTIRDV